MKTQPATGETYPKSDLFNKAPEAPKPPQIGMANPASVYCQQKGGTLIPVQTAQGVSNNCKLPGGETIDEWALWRRDHPAGEK
ncbi:putative hemolysin [Escherichia coli]|nr:DUF333 domain-containing protein [Escherichia coli]